MSKQNIETVYEALAEGIDAVGEQQASTYLAKVCLALAQALNDPSHVAAIARKCTQDLAD